jgi:hypothetical protein
VEEKKYPDFRDVKILVSPKDISSKYATFWSLFLETDLDEDGNMMLSL